MGAGATPPQKRNAAQAFPINLQSNKSYSLITNQMSQSLDSEGGKPTYGIELARTVGLGANHEKRRVTLKNHGQVIALSPCRPGPFNIVPAVKANDTKRPLCVHVQVNEEAGGASGCVAEPTCCRKLSAQPCQHSNHHFLLRWPMKPSPRHVGNHSGCLIRSNRLWLDSVLVTS